MSIIDSIQDRITGAYVGITEGAHKMFQAFEAKEESTVRTKEGLADLELALEDVSWRDLTAPYGSWNFNRLALRRIMALSRMMYLMNPLIKRAVTVQELYVWGSGVRIKADNPAVNQVLDDFFKDPKNQKVIGASWNEREQDQRIEGNTFFVFYLNKANGTSRVRLLPVDQVDDIVFNPDDAKEPWFYVRSMISTTGEPVTDNTQAKRMLFPDIDYEPVAKPAVFQARPGSGYEAFNGVPIMWNTRVLHVKTGGISQMRFGLPELFSALNWATAYKKMLENFATKEQAFARLAMKMTGLPGKKGIAASKDKLGTGINQSRILDNNPPANTASWLLSSGNVDVSAIKTSGMQTSPDTARPLRSMVAAGSDTPEHFFGDSDIGNFATSSTLDRPTELKMVARQRMWMQVICKMCDKLMEWSALAPQGKLRDAGFKATRSRDPFDALSTVIITPPAAASLQYLVEFPNILERDVTDRVRSLVMAATLGGRPAEGIFTDRKVLFRLLLQALAVPNAEDVVEDLYPESVTQGFADPADKMDDEHLIALGRKELGDAALDQADAAKTKAAQPTLVPKAKPSGSPAAGASNR